MSQLDPDAARPTIRLKPNADARAIRHGTPWVFDSDLVMDRRTRKLPAGTLAILEDTERSPMALVAFNPNSRISARVLDLDPDAKITLSWMSGRIAKALDLRARMFDTPYYRLIHAEADGLPGVVVDRFGDLAVIQPNAAWAEQHLDLIVEALKETCSVTAIVKNASSRARKHEGLGDETSVLFGSAPTGSILVPMNDARYAADVIEGQKTGLFFDQRANHRFAASLVRPDDRVLDVFSHVGGFGLAMLASGAASALAVDASAAALALAEEGAQATGVKDRFLTRRGDAFDIMADLREAGETFDVVVCDPPAFAPSKKVLGQGLRAYERVARAAAPLVSPGGILCLCSCSHAAGVEKFRASSARGIGRAGRQARLIHTGFAGPDHPQLPHLAESAYLKALFFAL